ncbi:hypothetical protein [Streptomyces sp. NPDC059819]|uniref:hypothetical protein n=1 Tax=Streptomyces sp. NPDC059819 TaxID=3346963 RepID=UPI0036483FBC
MSKLTTGAFWVLVKGVFATARPDSSQHPRTQFPACGKTGPVMKGATRWEVLFAECGHVVEVPETLRDH